MFEAGMGVDVGLEVIDGIGGEFEVGGDIEGRMTVELAVEKMEKLVTDLEGCIFGMGVSGGQSKSLVQICLGQGLN